MPDSQLNIEKIRSIANQKLHYSAQIKPDDPVLSVLIINDALFQDALETLVQTMSDLQAQQNSAIQKQVDMVNLSFEHKLVKSADYLKREVEKAIEAGQASIQSTARYEIAQMQQVTQISYIGAAFWFASGAATIGTIILKILRLI
jgi:hypothetical protein